MSQDKGEAVSLSTPALVTQFDLLARAPGGVARLRALILALAVRGKLVPQDSREDPARLEVVVEQVLQLIADGKVPKSRASEPLEDRSDEWELPGGWAAVRGSDVFIPRSGNSKLIKGKLFSEPGEGLYAGYSASGQDVWLSSFEYDGTAVILSAVGARCGKAFLARGKWSAIANTHIVWPIEGVVSGEYAMLLLNDESFWIRSGGAQPFLKVTETLQRTVLIPPLREQARIVARVDELMQLCDALEAKGRLEAQQHARLLETLLGTLTESTTPEELAANWQRVAEHFDLLLDQPEAVDVLEQTVLQLAVRGLLVPQDPSEEPANDFLVRLRSERQRALQKGKAQLDDSWLPVEKAPYTLPSGWIWTTIDAIADVGTGTTPSRENSAFFMGGTIPWVTSGETGQAFIRKTEQHVTELALANTSLTVYPVGTLIVAMYGQGKTRGQVSELCLEATTNQACAAIVLTEKSALHRGFVKLVFEKSYDEIRAMSAGGAQPNLNVGKVKASLVPLPPLAEQARIVARVAGLRRLCADLRQRLAASQATQSRLAEALVESALA
jgi:type I restriction enzyme S subunit